VNKLIFKGEAHMGAKRLIMSVAIGLLVLGSGTNVISDGKDDKPCQLVIKIGTDGKVNVKAESCKSFDRFPPGSKVDLGSFTGRQEGCAVLPTTGSPDCVSYLYRGNFFTACN
jgi:hypothetical protein